MTRSAIPETAVAAPVVEWLTDLGWEVYQEVDAFGPRADIVGVRGPLVWVVEAKTSLSLKLLDQACGWLSQANYVSVVVPERHRWNRFVGMFMRDHGIGEFRIEGDGGKWNPFRAVDHLDPVFHRRVDQSIIRRALHPEQKAQIAGSAGGGYTTPFSRTCDNVRRWMREHPRSTLKEVIDGVEHHYANPASAVNSLRHWIISGKVQGVKWDGNRPVLSNDEAA